MKRVFLYNLNSRYGRLFHDLPAKQLADSIHLSIHKSHENYGFFFLKSSQRSAAFPGNETVIQAGPGREQGYANSHIPCVECSPLGHVLNNVVCQPLGPGLPGNYINCLRHEVVYGITNMTLA